MRVLERWQCFSKNSHCDLDLCRVPKCPTALNVRQILFFSKSVILVTKININSKISKYFKKIISEKYSESNLEKKLPDI